MIFKSKSRIVATLCLILYNSRKTHRLITYLKLLIQNDFCYFIPVKDSFLKNLSPAEQIIEFDLLICLSIINEKNWPPCLPKLLWISHYILIPTFFELSKIQLDWNVVLGPPMQTFLRFSVHNPSQWNNLCQLSNDQHFIVEERQRRQGSL